jgi:hypothetical protein
MADTKITYQSDVIAEINGGQTATLKCNGMKMNGDVTVESLGGGSNALIVTGTFPTSYETVNNVAKATVESLSLSHTTKEMCEAFAEGRDVRIKLVNAVYNQEFGGWGLKHAELVVSSATDFGSGMFTFSAYGLGYTRETNVGQYTTETTPLLLDYNLSTAGYLRTPVKGTESAKIIQDVTSALLQNNAPLIVTGSSAAASSDVLMSEPNKYALYYVTLSYSPSQIADAFNRGKDVYIRLSDASGQIGDTNLPGITSIEARVNSVYYDQNLFGGYYISAAGEGNCSIPSQYYRLTIAQQQNQEKAMVYAYLYNSVGM